MDEMIYYPGFFPKDDQWLKFALLYYDKLHLIVPYEAGDYHNWAAGINQEAVQIIEEAGFIELYDPSAYDAFEATIAALKCLTQYLKNPQWLSKLLTGQRDSAIGQDILNEWQNERNHDTVLFSAKASIDFFHYCERKKYGTKCNNGIKVPKQLANIYMSILADVISRNTGMEMVTDDAICNQIATQNTSLIYELLPNKGISRVKSDESLLAQSEIEYYLPINLKDIKFEDIIRLRKDNRFRVARDAFSRSVKELVDKKAKGEPSSMDAVLASREELRSCLFDAFEMLVPVVVTVFAIKDVTAAKVGRIEGFVRRLLALAQGTMELSDLRENMPENLLNLYRQQMAKKYVASLRNINNPFVNE